jgi:hypothetical protein
MCGMSAIVLKLPTRRGPSVNAIPARPESARIIDLSTYRRSRSRRPDFDSDDDDEEEEERWEVRVQRVIDAAEALLEAGHREDVLVFCARAADCLGRNAAEIGDTRAVVGLTARLGELRARASGGG